MVVQPALGCCFGIKWLGLVRTPRLWCGIATSRPGMKSQRTLVSFCARLRALLWKEHSKRPKVSRISLSRASKTLRVVYPQLQIMLRWGPLKVSSIPRKVWRRQLSTQLGVPGIALSILLKVWPQQLTTQWNKFLKARATSQKLSPLKAPNPKNSRRVRQRCK